ncbi:MAG TPA: exodeoxyribonuclease VII small subunit [Bacteroidales bacterium]|nr:exodeoxyribonuclease VII small subunit [Bacteroidales bacterium]
MEKKKLSYKEALSEIEEILEKLENEELDVDKLTESIKRVSFLLKFCKERLTTTEGEVQKLIEDME